uniref:GP-PDE domain-containing protein n=1 Tax=Ascaris lumbricoides TaxID=6252 RepID=A0A9J2PLV1_ASCLU
MFRDILLVTGFLRESTPSAQLFLCRGFAARMARVPRSSLHFSVDVSAARPWEHVFVTGSTPSLGLWDPSKAVQLSPDPQNKGRWSGAVDVGTEPVQFRYFIGYYLESGKEGAGKELIVSKWESFLHPRSILPAIESASGVCHAHVTDTFGHNAAKEHVSEGWLIGENQNEILLRLHGAPFKFYKNRHASRSYKVKVTPFDLRVKETGSADDDDVDDGQEGFLPTSLPSFSDAYLAILSSEDPRYHSQLETGEHFRIDRDYFVFRTRSVAVEFIGFRIELFVHSEDGEDPNSSERFAISYALPSTMPGTFGIASLPLLAKSNRPVGQIMVDYLFIRSLQQPHPPQTMKVSYGRHWKKRQTLEVGHRGMGNSYTKMAAGRENTIHSLNSAAKNGADYVEFDVQLTKDKVAVIFHDFHVLVSVAKRSSSNLAALNNDHNSDYHELAVKELKLKQLQLLHTNVKRLQLDHYKAIDGVKKEGIIKVTGGADEGAERMPFPTLVDALKQVDPSVGFNVEVKYPMMQKNGMHECENYFEHNTYIDVILSDVLTYAGDRRIVFSSFDPDVCAIIAAKQHLYPVLFLCVGMTTRYEPFVDMRASTSNAAVNFAASINILGVNFHSEDLLRDPSPVQRANKFGLVSFVWGDDLDNKENINYFKKELLVDGIIYDRIETPKERVLQQRQVPVEYVHERDRRIGEVEARRNVFMVEREAKTALFRRAVSPGASRTVSLSLEECPGSPTASDSLSISSSSTISPVHTPPPQPRHSPARMSCPRVL